MCKGEDYGGSFMSLIKSVSGVRGIVRADRPEAVTMTDEVARRLGRAYATYLVRLSRKTGRLMLVGGRDGRPGGEALLSAFAEGTRASGVGTLDMGIVTTPGVALMVKAAPAPDESGGSGVAGGVVITASHNPDQWNGVKFMTSEGRAPTTSAAGAIFKVFDGGDFHDGPMADPVSPLAVDPHAHHVETVARIVDVQRIRRRSFSVVLDSINGAGAESGRLLLERLGCTVVHMNAEPAATFAHTPEPKAENLADLCARVCDEGADIGFAQDPDADRVAIVDEHGRYIGEEYSLALAAKRVFQTDPGPVAANLSTSRMIDDLAAAAGEPCRVYRSAVGEANVVEMMTRQQCVIGGEGNGGVIDPRVVYVRDSLVGMALVLDLLAAEGRSVSQLVRATRAYAMIKEKITCDRERIAGMLGVVRQAFAGEMINDLDGLRIDWPDEKKWVHVRASNTEPVMRLIIEAPTATAARELIDRVRTVIASTPPNRQLLNWATRSKNHPPQSWWDDTTDPFRPDDG